MAYKHHQATVSFDQQNALDNLSNAYDSSVVVYGTKYSYPSEGLEYTINDLNMDAGLVAPTSWGVSQSGFVLRGNNNALVFDYVGGGPPGATSDYWHTAYQGHIYGCSTSNTTMTFKFIYTGSIKVSVNNTNTTFATDGDLGTTIYDDWDFDPGSGIKTAEFSTTITNPLFSTYGAFPLLVRYWNSGDTPHIVGMVKRDGIDDDFVLISTSNISKYATGIYSSTATACEETTIENVISWDINRDHDQITKATFNIFVENTTSANAYDQDTESFGDIAKGKLVEIYAGYNGVTEKRFVGNIVGNTGIRRTPYGAEVSVVCEGVMSFMLDEKNFNYPNNASYSLAGYTDTEDLYTNPNGIDRPIAFDQWNLTTAVKTLAMQSGIDPAYLETKRKYYDDYGNETTSTTGLLRDLGIYLSRRDLLYTTSPNINVDIEEEDKYIWVYDFGQDSVYDIVKDMLSKYGFYIAEVHGGADCGSIDLVEIDTPLTITDTITASGSSNYTTGQLEEYAEGFRETLMDPSVTSVIILDWTGKSVDIIMPRHEDFASSVGVEYKVDSGDVDWTNIAGYINNGELVASSSITPYLLGQQVVWHYYNGISTSTGNNSTVFRIVFGVDSNDIIDTGIPYGAHLLRLTKTATEEAYFDCLFTYDYDLQAYDKYNTTDLIQDLNITHELTNLRNDIVVLGASSAGFSFTADPDDLEEVKDKYITSRAVDVRSINDDSYKYYIGRNKKFIIEDPTIITQERADWLARYVLEEYRKTATSSSFTSNMDLGLQLYDNILVEDVKTQTADKYANFVVQSLKETYSADSYIMVVNGSSRGLPPSFRKRQELTAAEIDTYFNNCPVAFEKVSIPILDDNTSYDPMTSEEGSYIELTWTVLAPGIIATEVFDTRVEYENPTEEVRNGEYGINNLIAVPFLSKETIRPGRYTVRWDGVHEGYDLNEKFNDTKYDKVIFSPEGTGFFARGQDTLLVDEVDPAAVMEDHKYRIKGRTYFPVYVVSKFEPVNPEHLDVLNTYVWGTENATSSINGVENTGNDTSALDIQHFDLEERIPLCWGFDEDNMTYPTDGTSYVRKFYDPYDVAEPVADSLVLTDEYIEENDITHKCLYFDAKKPFGYDGPLETFDDEKLNAVMPVMDENVGIRLFIDSPGLINRRFYIERMDLIYSVITMVKDDLVHKVTALDNGRTDGDYVPWSGNQRASRYQTYINTQQTSETPQSIKDIPTSTQTVALQKWTYLPAYSVRNDAEAVIFSCNLSTSPSTLNTLDPECVNYANTSVSGFGVGKVLAIPYDERKDFDLEDLPYLQNEHAYIPYKRQVHTVDGNIRTNDEFDYYFVNVNSDEFPSMTEEAVHASNQIRYHLRPGDWEHYTGTASIEREIYNSAIVSIDALIFDRAGRAYLSVAKGDEGHFFTGRHNEIEIHSDYIEQMLPYVNRYDPYLPTACYMEREPEILNMTDSFGTYASEFTHNTAYDINPYTGLDFSKKIKNLHTLGPNNIFCLATSPYLIFDYFHWIVPDHVPNFNLTELCYGNKSMFFSDGMMHRNSYVNDAHFEGDPDTRLNGPDEVKQAGAFGLPLYIAGGHVFNGQYPFPGDVAAQLWYKNRDALHRQYWATSYVRDRLANGSVFYPSNQRTDFFGGLHNLPVFTLVGKAVSQKAVSY